ncbi:hypothetical protein R6242_10805 [Iodobacter sp. CM08]|uniref:hypothetical protein n=1 Tax=Iodobacter sp. CM08 TaxID=3085902 RepID=UPI002981AA34|nr:hypothetical protein [Iodobacter sp. CM08]MDW5417054.1 hypothetical protein [Iodobacter sp. CM08]
MAKAMKIIGRMKCTCCGEVVPVKEQSNGLAIVTCNFCDNKMQAFGKVADGHIRLKMNPVVSDIPANPVGVAAPVPAQPKKSFFDLSL